MPFQRRKYKNTPWKAIQNGDKKAFDAFYFEHVDALYNYGHHITPQTNLVEDAIQEVFVNLWQRRQQINIESSNRAYLFTCLRRQLLYQLKHQENYQLKKELVAVGHSIWQEERSEYRQKQQLQAVKQAVEKLSPREKEAITLKYYENLDYHEMSSIMNLKIHAIYKLVSRGVNKLRKKFQ